MEIVVCGVAVQPLIIVTGKMVDLERFTSIEKLLRVRSYVLQYVHNIKFKIIKYLKL